MTWLEVDPTTLKYPFDHDLVAAFVETNSSAALGLVKRFSRWEVAFSHPVRGTQPIVEPGVWADGLDTMKMQRDDAVAQFRRFVGAWPDARPVQ